MEFTDKAIVLSSRPHAESSAIVQVLTQEHGLFAGLTRGATGKAQRGIWESGNRVMITWKARLAEQLGNISGELLAADAAALMQDGMRLAALTSAATLIELCIAEREPHPELFEALDGLIQTLKSGEQWVETYARFELALLSSCGFRLDFSACAATGVKTDLIYVSPVTGRAVSRSAGGPYQGKLLALPAFLLPEADTPATQAELQASLNMTGYFLNIWVLQPHGRSVPAARTRLIEQLWQSVAA